MGFSVDFTIRRSYENDSAQIAKRIPTVNEVNRKLSGLSNDSSRFSSCNPCRYRAFAKKAWRLVMSAVAIAYTERLTHPPEKSHAKYDKVEGVAFLRESRTRSSNNEQHVLMLHVVISTVVVLVFDIRICQVIRIRPWLDRDTLWYEEHLSRDAVPH